MWLRPYDLSKKSEHKVDAVLMLERRCAMLSGHAAEFTVPTCAAPGGMMAGERVRSPVAGTMERQAMR